MGILNVTPDSFFDGGRYLTPQAAIEGGLAMVEDGADIVDIGGESSRPWSRPITAQEEIDRVLPVIEGIRRECSIPLSIDTTKAAVARESLAAGVSIVNDISALRFDPAMAETIVRASAFVVLMHMQGTPERMQENPHYDDVVGEIRAFLSERIDRAVQGGIPRDRIIIDPGIGFGKLLSHNLSILQNLDQLSELGPPVLVGVSRKSFLGALLGEPSSEGLEGTIAANAIAVLHGASILRVHDVKEGRRTADVAFRVLNVPANL